MTTRVRVGGSVSSIWGGEPEENCKAKGDPLADEEVGVDKVSELLVARAEDALGRVELAERAAARLGRPPRGGGVALEEVCGTCQRTCQRTSGRASERVGGRVAIAAVARAVWRQMQVMVGKGGEEGSV